MKKISIASLVKKLQHFLRRGGFCPSVELHWEGFAPAACIAGLFKKKKKLGQHSSTEEVYLPIQKNIIQLPKDHKPKGLDSIRKTVFVGNRFCRIGPCFVSPLLCNS